MVIRFHFSAPTRTAGTSAVVIPSLKHLGLCYPPRLDIMGVVRRKSGDSEVR